MRNKLLLGLTLTTSLTAPAFAEQWYEVGTSTIEIALADKDSLQRAGNTAVMNVFHGFEYGQGEGSSIYYAKRKLEFNCNARQVRQLQIDTFDVSHAALQGGRSFDTSWLALETGSAEEAASKLACGEAFTGETYTDPFMASDDYWDYMYYYYGDGASTS